MSRWHSWVPGNETWHVWPESSVTRHDYSEGESADIRPDGHAYCGALGVDQSDPRAFNLDPRYGPPKADEWNDYWHGGDPPVNFIPAPTCSTCRMIFTERLYRDRNWQIGWRAVYGNENE